MKLVLGAATAALAFAGLTAAPQASADELANLKARIAKLEQAEAAEVAASKDNMVFFRGGFANNNIQRTDATNGPNFQTSSNGYHVGAGLDFNIDDNLFGLHDGTEVLAELQFTYSEFGRTPGSLLNTVGAVVEGDLGAPGALPTLTGSSIPATVSQFTLTASPKIKFLKGNAFRPWIIPMGLGLNVISPTSTGVTYLKPSMQFGFGADYQVIKNIYIGADFRYNLGLAGAPDSEINIDGLTTGGYLGLGF